MPASSPDDRVGAWPLLAQPLPRGRHGLPRELVERSQHHRLIRAVIEAVADNGYLGTSVKDITARAKVSRTAFYRFFDNRQDAFLAACDLLLEEMFEQVAVAYSQAPTWLAQMREGLRALLRFLAADPAGARVLMLEITAAIGRAGGRYQMFVAAFEGIGDQGRASAPAGEQLPAAVASMTLGGVAGMVLDEILAGRTTDLEARLPEVLYTAIVPYVGHGEAVSAMRASTAG